MGNDGGMHGGIFYLYATGRLPSVVNKCLAAFILDDRNDGQKKENISADAIMN